MSMKQIDAPEASNTHAVSAAKVARAAGLVYVSDEEPGITRRRIGRGFGYRTPSGRPVRDAKTLARIRALAIPPAYTEVWICRDPRGHLQATGRDARRRKQYRYHPQWAAERDDRKFERLLAFGRALPRLRRRLRADLSLPGYPRDKVLAIVVALLADTMARIGNRAYARDNGSYGLTTLRNHHLRFVAGGRARLKFKGKGGQATEIAIDDKRLAKLVRGCQQLPGQMLFQYRDDGGALQPVDSGMVNDYLGEAMGDDFTAKDFRTWGGTLHAVRGLAATPLPKKTRGGDTSERALTAAQNAVVKEVAAILGNTAAVCRKAYIDPVVFSAWRDGSLVAATAGARGQRQWEQATLRMLRRPKRSGTPNAKRKARER